MQLGEIFRTQVIRQLHTNLGSSIFKRGICGTMVAEINENSWNLLVT